MAREQRRGLKADHVDILTNDIGLAGDLSFFV